MKKIVPIVNLAAKFSIIKRATGYRKDHLENDTEHSYQLAMVCWSANEQYNLGLNDELILKFALSHDLVEIYAGDVDAFGDKQKIIDKKKNEEKALQVFNSEYSQFKGLVVTIERYEKKEDVEAQLVYVMDKLIQEVNIYNSTADYYQSRGVNFEDWRKWLLQKINYEFLNFKLKSLVDESIVEIEETYKSNFSV